MADFCPRIDSEDYKELIHIFGSTDLAHLLWDRNGGHMLDLDPDGNPSILFHQLLKITNNDRFETLRLKSQFYLENYTNENGRWYLPFVEEPLIDDRLIYREIHRKQYESLLNRLSQKLGYSWRYANKNDHLKEDDAAIVDLYGSDNPVVVVRPDRLDYGDVVHEFGHILFAHIKRDNSKLYDNLVDTIKHDSKYSSLIEFIHNKYDTDDQLRLDNELITYVLGDYGKNLIDEKTGLFKAISEFWDKVKELLKNVFGFTTITDFKTDTTIEQLAHMLLDPEFNIDFGKTMTSEEHFDLILGGDYLDELLNYRLNSTKNAVFSKKIEPESPKLTQDEIKNKFKEHSKNIISKEVEEKGKKKIHLFWRIDENTEQPLVGIRRHMSKFGFEYRESDEDNLSYSLRSGSIIHKSLENIANDVIEDLSGKHGIVLTQQAKKDLQGIFSKLKGKGTVMTEVAVADPDKGLVGIIDLVVIDENGNVHLYDFKTKTRGLVKYEDSTETLDTDPFIWFNKVGRAGYSDQSYAHAQLSMYAYLIQKNLGISVSSISVVKLNAITQGYFKENSKRARGYEFVPSEDSQKRNYISSIEVSKETPDDSRVSHAFVDERNRVLLHHKTRRMYEGNEAYASNRLLENQAMLERDLEEKAFAGIKESESLAGEMLYNLKKDIASRVTIARKRFDVGQRASLEDLVTALENEESITTSLYLIIKDAFDNVIKLMDEYNTYKTDKKEFTPGLLYHWKDVVQSYKSLNQLKLALDEHPDIIPSKEFVKNLDYIIEKVNKFENLYKTEGRLLIARWLTPYYHGIKVKYEDIWKSEFRKLQHREVKKGKMSLDQFEKQYGTIEEFVDKRHAGDKKKIEKETFNLLYKELEIASNDVGELTRWLDNMLDASDPVASAMVSAFVEAEEKSRMEAIDKKFEINEALEHLMEHHKKGNFTSEEDFYSFMLEHDESGKLTQYIVKPFKNKFWEDIAAIRKEYNLSRTKEETKMAIGDFMRDYSEFNDEDFRLALKDYLEELRKTKQFNLPEYKAINQYLIDNPEIIRIYDIIKMEEVGNELAAKLEYWWVKNRSLFYEYKDKYKNPEWGKFMTLCGIDSKLSIYNQMKALKNSNNPYAVFYNLIEDLEQQANQMVPNGYRIHDRLPGVVKLNNERLKAGQNPFTIAKNMMDIEFFIRPEDVQRGSSETTDEFGRVRYFIPVYYTAKVEPENQSYDLAGIYYKFWQSANEYRNKRNILPELEMTRYLINERKAIKRNVFGDILKKGNVDTPEKVSYIDKTSLASMLNDWFDMAVYGKYSADKKAIVKLSDTKSVDLMKTIDMLNRYTSLNLLGGNIVQGFANVAIGEVMQSIEVIAHEYVSAKSYTKASALYTHYLPQVLGDVGRNVPKSFAGLLFEEFNVLDEPVEETLFTTNTAAGKFLKNTSIYFVQHAGEHWLQNRFLIAMLLEQHAYEKNTGKDLGSILYQYEIKDGKLVLNDRVDKVKSKMTDTDVLILKRKIKGVLSRMHGEYSDLGRVAIQRNALGRMAYLFRKFVLPGWRRRWGSMQYIERMGQYTEGNYITTARFFRDYWRDLLGLKFALMSENWAGLSDHEKANIRRTLSEVTFLIACCIMAGAMGGGPDDEEDEWLTSFLAYQAYRLRAELTFFVSPASAWQILRSPMASMSVLQNLVDFSSQLTHPGELYKRGPFKGQLKLKKIMLDFVPIYKQIYKARDIQQQISWFKQ